MLNSNNRTTVGSAEQQHLNVGHFPFTFSRLPLEPGLYLGKIKLYGVSEACKKACRSANFLVKYTKKETGSALEGDEALELTMANYGRDECGGGSYLSRRRRERASWTVGSTVGVCAVQLQERSASALVRWPMPIGHMFPTHRTSVFAKNSRLRRTQL